MSWSSTCPRSIRSPSRCGSAWCRPCPGSPSPRGGTGPARSGRRGAGPRGSRGAPSSTWAWSPPCSPTRSGAISSVVTPPPRSRRSPSSFPSWPPRRRPWCSASASARAASSAWRSSCSGSRSSSCSRAREELRNRRIVPGKPFCPAARAAPKAAIPRAFRLAREMLGRRARRSPMLKPASGFKGLTIAAVDGDLGSVADLYFDDLSWTVRYLVVDTGTWLPGRQVLISPLSVREAGDKILVALTQAQVKHSPPVESDKPVNRQQEEAIARYYDQRYYWEGPYRWGLLAYPGMPPVPTAPIPVEGVTEEMVARDRQTELGDPSLRSTRDVTGYYIAALDGDLGHVDDFLIDDREWAIRYLVVDTRNWWPGKKVVLSPDWIKTVSWTDSQVHVDLRRDEIKAAPEYDASRPFDRAYENRLFDHLHRR